MKVWRRVATIMSLLFLLLGSLPYMSATTYAAGYRGGRMTVVDEPETFSSADVTYRIGEEVRPASELLWVDEGHTGKALKLTGNGEFLRLRYTATQVRNFTFSCWINWQGDAGYGLYGQRVFTVARSTSHFLTVSPYIKDPQMRAGDGFLNGLYLGYQYGGSNGKVLNLFNPTSDDVFYALPQNEWHHIAVVSNERTLALYIDGVRWFEEQLLTGLVELRANSLDIGSGEWGDPTLNALLDDVILYNSALSEERIKELAGRTQETTVYFPTAPTTTTTEAPSAMTMPIPTTTMPTTLGKTVFGVPMWGIRIIVGVLIVYVILVIILNVLKAHEQKGKM